MKDETLLDKGLAMANGDEIETGKNAGMTDEEVVTRVLSGDTGVFEIIMRRHNQRLYRASRAILRDDAQAEDVVQDAYVRAYQHLGQFAGKSQFGGWLLRIAVNEALARLRGRKRFEEASAMPEGDRMDRFASPMPNPEQQASNTEIRTLLEQSIDALAEPQRTVLVMRDVEEMSTAETAEALGITEENVKVRLHRARAILRRKLYTHASVEAKSTFAFLGMRCDRVVRNVLRRIQNDGLRRERAQIQ
jgi:RNA polymerase sigma-70 factor, ECF subfamily